MRISQGQSEEAGSMGVGGGGIVLLWPFITVSQQQQQHNRLFFRPGLSYETISNTDSSGPCLKALRQV